MAITLLEFLFPPFSCILQEFRLNNSDNGLVWRIRQYTELQAWFHLLQHIFSIVINLHLFNAQIFDFLSFLYLFVNFLHILILFLCPSSTHNLTLLQFVAHINQIQFLQIFQVEIFVFPNRIIIFVLQVKDQFIHCFSVFGMLHHFFVLLIILLSGNWHHNQIWSLDLCDLMQIIERVKAFTFITLQIEERHGRIQHFCIFSLEQFLPDFERISLIYFWAFKE